MGPRRGTPCGSRTRIAGSRIRRPEPLDERGESCLMLLAVSERMPPSKAKRHRESNWCRGEESNLHAFRQRVLNPPCLPIPATPANTGGRDGTRTRTSLYIPRRHQRRERLLCHSSLSDAPKSGASGGSRTHIPRLRGGSSAVELPRRMFPDVPSEARRHGESTGAAGGSRTLIPCLKGRSSGR